MSKTETIPISMNLYKEVEQVTKQLNRKPEDFIIEAVETQIAKLKKPLTKIKKDLDLQLIPLKIVLCKPFYEFIEEYRQYFGAKYTTEQICMSMIYSQVKRLFNELDSFARKKDSFLDKSDFFSKYSYLGIVSWDDPDEEDE